VSIDATAETVQPTPEAAALNKAVETIRTALGDLDTAPGKDRAAKALETMASALETMSSTEEEMTADTIQSALAETRSLAEAAIAPEEGWVEEEPVQATASARVGFGERLDQLAFRYYGDAAGWRLLAVFNDIDDPLRLSPGRLLRVPSALARGT
jgi:nucleoid-associated protein YgaU